MGTVHNGIAQKAFDLSVIDGASVAVFKILDEVLKLGEMLINSIVGPVVVD